MGAPPPDIFVCHNRRLIGLLHLSVMSRYGGSVSERRRSHIFLLFKRLHSHANY